MEAFWSQTRIELLNRKSGCSCSDLANEIADYIEIFNNRRSRHSQIDYASWFEYELPFRGSTHFGLIFMPHGATTGRGDESRGTPGPYAGSVSFLSALGVREGLRSRTRCFWASVNAVEAIRRTCSWLRRGVFGRR